MGDLKREHAARMRLTPTSSKGVMSGQGEARNQSRSGWLALRCAAAMSLTACSAGAAAAAERTTPSGMPVPR
jgi:hypothetical protein